MDAGEKSIVRIGGRSKSEMISKYQLKALARKENRGDSYSKRRVKQVHAQLFKLKEEIESIIEVFKSPLDWTQPSGGVQEYLEMEDPHILSFLSTPKATHDGFHIIGPNNKKLGAGDLWKCWRSGERFPEWLLPHMRLDVETFDEFTNFWLTPRDERIARIETWRQGVLSAITYDLADLIQQFNQLASENRVLCHEMELEVLRSARIIGATTSGAAANHDLLSSKAADVVIVEEAGEVLESHILTALSGGRDGRGASKHLILIGDHKQLPPKVENYELTTASGFGYNLDCSLFERMIHAGSPSVALEVQHRMRPCVSSLIRAQTYPSLRDHDSVFKYDDVRGVNDNLVFIDHDYKEDGADADNSTTKSNDYEAKFCLEIVRYLLLQGYRSDQIVVLTPYLGQLLKILSMMKSKLKDVSALVSERDLDDMEDLDPEEAKQAKSEQSKEQATKKIIRCSSIDNYQGEEADIVVISRKYSCFWLKLGYALYYTILGLILSHST